MNQNRVTILTVLVLAVAALATGVPAEAGATRVVLNPVNPDQKIGGFAVLGSRGKDEVFSVRVFANMPDKTLLSVFVSKGEKTFEVTRVYIELGAGLARLDSKFDVSPVFPLAEVDEIIVRYRGETVLRGTVPKLDR